MASQKRPSQRHGSKYLATASTMDHARHGFLPRHRDTGILDSIGRFFGGDRGVPKRGSGKDSHHAARTAHYGSLPQKSHGRTQDENPVVHFFKNITEMGRLGARVLLTVVGAGHPQRAGARVLLRWWVLATLGGQAPGCF
uniref:Myelin basic protein n=1 Tax=Cercocebus atys TaxID=9531 RepID=A0A2K5LHF2_CERAT